MPNGDGLTGQEIAIVGMACRFPGADGVEAFWRNLSQGVESVSFFSQQELQEAGIAPELYERPDYVRAGAVLSDIELFDAPFFGLSPREAALMDVQHRIFLECAWEALEDAGCDPERDPGLIGVYAGSGMNTYLLNQLFPNRKRAEMSNVFQVKISNDKDFMPSRASYKLGLRGPAVSVQSGCSTSLVAVHLACQGLLSGDCETALAGGSTVTVPQKTGYLFEEGMVLSPDGRCRAFDAESGGTVAGNGAGVVVLKRLEDALEEGNHLYAVIRGSAINNDGSAKVGFTAPGVDGQREVIQEALETAEVEAESIGCIEAHGSGTSMGDPIEAEALKQAFDTKETGFCAIGSVKTNLGHLDTAAGVAGLIKTALALQRKQLPPSLNFSRPNPAIDFEHSPFYVNTQLRDWKRAKHPRRAGVSSFGIGGTNAHVILEEAPPQPESARNARGWQLIPISARSDEAVQSIAANLRERLQDDSSVGLSDLAYTLQTGRKRFERRRCWVAATSSELIEELARPLDASRKVQLAEGKAEPSVVFLFPGLGDHRVDMARELYQREPLFRECFDQCCRIFQEESGVDPTATLYPDRPVRDQGGGASFKSWVRDQGRGPSGPLDRTLLAQPAVFAVEYALARLWMSWGVHPQAMIGYSVGEYVAACLSGVFGLRDAARLVVRRAQMIESLPQGAMLAASLGESEFLPYLSQGLGLAAVNSDSLCVAAGGVESIEALGQRLSQSGVSWRRLATRHAFHSELMKPIAAELRQLLASMRLEPPEIPYVSNLSGDWISDEQALDPDYWVAHTCGAVRFAEGIATLLDSPGRALLEVGPGQSLSAFAWQSPACESHPPAAIVASLPEMEKRESDQASLLRALGDLWEAGVDVDWEGLHGPDRPRLVRLPTYPFERQRHWIEAPPEDEIGQPAAPPARAHLNDWLYLPSWRRTPFPAASSSRDETASWLILSDRSGLGSRLCEILAKRGHPVTLAFQASAFSELQEDRFELDPGDRGQLGKLISILESRGRLPQRILHLWSLAPRAQLEPSPDRLEHDLDCGFFSLMHLLQALGEQSLDRSFRVAAVSCHMQDVTGGEVRSPQAAPLLGLVKTAPMEYRNIACVSIDLTLPEGDWSQQLCRRLIDELESQAADDVVAYRGRSRWVRTFDKAPFEEPPESRAVLREKGVYLITGGLGGLGLTMADFLAQRCRARLVLAGRSGLGRLDSPAYEERKKRIQAIEADGGRVLVLEADASDPADWRSLLERAADRFGPVNGIIHAAGVAGAGVIQLKSKQAAQEVFRPKIAGSLALLQELDLKDVDFVALFSSAAGVLGGFGQSDYAAANAFLDALAHYASGAAGAPVLAIDWDAWQLDSWGVESLSAFPHLAALHQRNRQEYGIPSGDGCRALLRALACDQPQALILTRDFNQLSDEISSGLGELDPSAQAKARPPAEGGRRAGLRSEYVAPRSETEKAIARIWQELLGVEAVGVRDSFLEWGGDSLIGIQLMGRLNENFQLSLPLNTLFQSPTVEGLSRAVEESILSEIEAISDEEAAALTQSEEVEPLADSVSEK